ncbi:hypothetical protein HZA98_00305 [Candidatus Woesearchaeota archaeon]|nr:hypothetical protein [Candidatus Woesearchaeota archaeon]
MQQKTLWKIASLAVFGAGFGADAAIEHFNKVQNRENIEDAVKEAVKAEDGRIQSQLICITWKQHQEVYANQMARMKGYDIPSMQEYEHGKIFSKHDLMDIIDGKSALAKKFYCQ